MHEERTDSEFSTLFFIIFNVTILFRVHLARNENFVNQYLVPNSRCLYLMFAEYMWQIFRL